MRGMKETPIHRLTADTTDLHFAEITCYVAGPLVLGLGFWKLGSLALSETELFFGVLLTTCLGFLCVIFGQLAGLSRLVKSSRSASRSKP